MRHVALLDLSSREIFTDFISDLARCTATLWNT